jgi:cardiolipin synthase A/B
VKVEGPAAAHLENVAYESLQRLQATDPSLRINMPNLNLGTETTPTEGAPVLVIDSNLLANRPQIQIAALAFINAASTHVYVTTPYFLPPAWLKKALTRASRRGVDVRIITAGHSDVPAVRYASQHIYSAFLKYVTSVLKFYYLLF